MDMLYLIINKKTHVLSQKVGPGGGGASIYIYIEYLLKHKLVGGFKHFLFSPLGEMIQFDEHIFQMG